MAITDQSDLALWLKTERKKRNLSQAKLAKFLMVHPAFVSRWEKGENPIPKKDIASITKFITKFDKQHSLGKINLQKSRYKREYLLSSEKINSVVTKKTKSPITKFDFSQLDYNNEKKGKAIALFAGVGGLSLGFKMAGYDVVGFAEIDEGLRKIYQANSPDAVCLGTDVRKITNEQVVAWKKMFGDIEVLMGGPPCQGFSLAGKRDCYDPRNQLYNDFARIASILKPKAVVLENVRVLTSMKTPDGSFIVEHFLRAFSEAGYNINFETFNVCDYGIPQERHRVIFIGTRKDLDIDVEFPQPTHGEGLKPYATFREVTHDLERLESGQKSKKDPLHFAISHPDHVIKMLKIVPEGCSAHENEDPSLRPTSGFNTTYKRIKWDEPSSTISTNFSMISGSRNVHPQDTRSLTIREAMRCQTFPDNFVVLGSLGNIRKGIGNAVPPLFAKKIAMHVNNLLAIKLSPQLAPQLVAC